MNRLHDIALGCVPFLKGRWRYLKNEDWAGYRQRAVLQDDTDRRRQIIFSDYYRGEGRFQVTGAYPVGQGNPPRITLSQCRSISDLGREINRRFLPSYLKHYDQSKSAHLLQIKKQEQLRIRAGLLKQIDPSMRPSHSHHGEVSTDYYLASGKLSLSSYSDQVRLDVRLSFDQVVRVLYLLNEVKD